MVTFLMTMFQDPFTDSDMTSMYTLLVYNYNNCYTSSRSVICSPLRGQIKGTACGLYWNYYIYNIRLGTGKNPMHYMMGGNNVFRYSCNCSSRICI